MKNYLIINEDKNIYFKNYIAHNLKHFVLSKNEAKVFKNKKSANKMLEKLNNKKYKIIEINAIKK